MVVSMVIMVVKLVIIIIAVMAQPLEIVAFAG